MMSHWVPLTARYYTHFIFVCEHVFYFLHFFFTYLTHHIFYKIYFNCFKSRFHCLIMFFQEQQMAPGLRLRSHSRPLPPTPEEMMDPPSEEAGTPPLPAHNVQPEDEVTASTIVGKFAKLFLRFNLHLFTY